MTPVTPAVEAVIRLYIPLYVRNTRKFIKQLERHPDWQPCTLNFNFYLGYIKRLFGSQSTPDCSVWSAGTAGQRYSVSYAHPAAGEFAVTLKSIRLFCFDTSISFLELSFSHACSHPDRAADLTNALRLSDQDLLCAENAQECISVNHLAKQLLLGFDTCRLFEHLMGNDSTRPELFVSLILSEADTGLTMDELDEKIHRIASSRDSLYEGGNETERCYAPFRHTRWAVTKRGVCGVGILTDNERDRTFIRDHWMQNTETRYCIWYILALHQKYALYHYLNEIAEKSGTSELDVYQKIIMNFNTKYRFSIISEEPSYQHLYEEVCKVNQLDTEFRDLDEEAARIADYYESLYSRKTSIGMNIISILCAVIGIRDIYTIVSSGVTADSFFKEFFALPTMGILVTLASIALFLYAILQCIPLHRVRFALRWLRDRLPRFGK